MIKKKSVIASTLFLMATSSVQAGNNIKHIPGIFVGATHAENETEFTFGVEYEYKLNKDWGAGIVYEKTNGAHHNDGVTVSLISGYYHPTKNVRLGLGFGKERIGGDHPHSEDLYRVSAAYDFHINDFGIAPTVAIDFIDDNEAIVFGVALTRPF